MMSPGFFQGGKIWRLIKILQAMTRRNSLFCGEFFMTLSILYTGNVSRIGYQGASKPRD
jgi:hypothetical protein